MALDLIGQYYCGIDWILKVVLKTSSICTQEANISPKKRLDSKEAKIAKEDEE